MTRLGRLGRSCTNSRARRGGSCVCLRVCCSIGIPHCRHAHLCFIFSSMSYSIIAASLLALFISGCNHPTPSRNDAPNQVSFIQDIAPILEKRCLVCHHSANAANCGGLNLETRQLAFTTGRNTPVIIPGDPDRSPLLAALLAREIHPVFMPMETLSSRETTQLR